MILIAMMGNTYTTVKDNSDKEWKFYRYRFIADHNASSTCAPPFNVIYMFYLYFRKCRSGGPSNKTSKSLQSFHELVVTKIMKDATERVIEYEEAKVRFALPSVSDSIHEHMRLLTAQRDSDRLYLEQQMETAANRGNNIESQLQFVADKLQVLNLGNLQGPADKSRDKDVNIDSKIGDRMLALEDRMIRLEKKIDDSEKNEHARLEKLDSLEKHMLAMLGMLQAQQQK